MPYIVARMGDSVVIREVTKTSCAYSMQREAAWSFAKRLAAPKTIQVGRKVTKVYAKPIYFVDLQMNKKLVREAQSGRTLHPKHIRPHIQCVSLRTGKYPVRPSGV